VAKNGSVFIEAQNWIDGRVLSRNSNVNADYLSDFYSSAEIFESVARCTEFVLYDKTRINPLVKAHLHWRFLSQQLDAIFVAL